MAVCTYFLRGNCKFGDNCRFEHPQNAQRPGGAFGNTSWTNPRNAGPGSKNTNGIPSFTADSIKNDLTPLADKPIWPLSSYGAAKYEPTLLAGIDESPEELRFRAFMAQQAGNTAEYVTYETNKISAAEQVYTNVLNNVNEAYTQAMKLSSNGNQAGSSSAADGTFGAVSAFGNLTTKSAFGSTGTSPAFGTPAFGKPTFGQASTPAPSISAFGQPQQPVSVFGQPQSQQADPTQQASAFGQSSQASSFIKPASGAFGNLTTTGSSSAFGSGGFSAFAGQPSAFGTNPTTTAPATSTFGQPSFGSGAPAAPQPTSAFGASSVPPASAFGAPSAFGGLPRNETVSAFGAPAAPASAFGSQGNVPSNPFTSSSNTAPPFAPSTTASGVSAFGALEPQKMQSAFSSQPPSAFPMASPSTSMFGGTSGPSTSSKMSSAPDFANAPSQYKPGLTPYDLNLPSDYLNRLPPEALEAFKSQKFEWGKVPDWIPPLELR